MPAQAGAFADGVRAPHYDVSPGAARGGASTVDSITIPRIAKRAPSCTQRSLAAGIGKDQIIINSRQMSPVVRAAGAVNPQFCRAAGHSVGSGASPSPRTGTRHRRSRSRIAEAGRGRGIDAGAVA